jgi:hypothetical protein
MRLLGPAIGAAAACSQERDGWPQRASIHKVMEWVVSPTVLLAARDDYRLRRIEGEARASASLSRNRGDEDVAKHFCRPVDIECEYPAIVTLDRGPIAAIDRRDGDTPPPKIEYVANSSSKDQ